MMLENQWDMPIKEEKQSNSEFQSLTSNPTQSHYVKKLKLETQIGDASTGDHLWSGKARRTHISETWSRLRGG
jgi:hypothetical protein